jgi:hypothetical protein
MRLLTWLMKVLGCPGGSARLPLASFATSAKTPIFEDIVVENRACFPITEDYGVRGIREGNQDSFIRLGAWVATNSHRNRKRCSAWLQRGRA